MHAPRVKRHGFYGRMSICFVGAFASMIVCALLARAVVVSFCGDLFCVVAMMYIGLVWFV